MNNYYPSPVPIPKRRRIVADDQRKKVSRACDLCKRRKQKCDGGSPCLTCMERTISCVYTRVDGRSTKVSSGAANTLPNHNQRAYIPASLQPLLSFPLEGGNDGDTSNPFLSDLLAAVPSFGESHMLKDKAGHLRYMGQGSTFLLLLRSSEIFERTLGPSKFTEAPMDIRRLDTARAPVSPKPLPLPDRQLVEYLVSLFEANVNVPFYVMDMLFLRKCIIDQIYASPLELSQRHLCLLHLVCAVGSVYAHIERTFPGPLLLAGSLFDSGLTLLRYGLDDGNLWLVEANYLIFHYYQATCMYGTAWVNLGTAIRYAQGIGLGKKGTVEDPVDESYMRHRRRLWRSLYISDRLSASHLGRDITIEDYQWTDTEMPKVPEEADPESPSMLHESCARELLLVCRILGLVIRDVYGVSQVQVARVRQLAVELKTWALQLHPSLHLDGALDTPPNPPRGINVDNHPLFLMHMAHLHTIMSLSYPFANCHIAVQLGHPYEGPQDHPPEVLEVFYEALLKAAILVISLTEHFLQGNTPPLTPCFLIHYVFHSGITVGLALLVQLKAPLAKNNLQGNVPRVLKAMVVSAILLLRTWALANELSQLYMLHLEEMLVILTTCEASGPVLADQSPSASANRDGTKSPNSLRALLKFQNWKAMDDSTAFAPDETTNDACSTVTANAVAP